MGRDCKYCGAYISDMTSVCTACGKRIKPEKPPEYDTYYRGSATAQTGREESGRTQERFYTRTSGERKRSFYGAEKETDEGKDKLAILAYLGPLFLIPYFVHPTEFVKYHCNQGLLLLLANIVLSAIGLEAIGALFQIYGMIIGIKSVLVGEKKQLPLIGGIRLLK